MNKLIAIGLACCLPTGLAAEDPAAGDPEATLGTTTVMVIQESDAMARDVVCTRGTNDRAASECMTVHRAVLTARMQKVSTLRERGRWM
jgi:hypothetical protein